MENAYVRPRDIVHPLICYLKKNTVMINLLSMTSVQWEKTSFSKLAAEVSKLPVFLQLLALCPISDLELEEFLRKVRQKFFELNDAKITDNVVKLQKAIANKITSLNIFN